MQKLIISLLFGLFACICMATIDTFEFSSATQEADFHQLTQSLRCPQCQNNNIADSNATIATDMREKVYELLQQGYTKPEITQYMIDRYGNFVTYDPPLNIATLFLWLLPLLLLVSGLIFIFRPQKTLKLQTLSSHSRPLTHDEQTRLNDILNKE